MEVEEINRGVRKTRKTHQCYDCYTMIPAGTDVVFFTGKVDGRAYTLYYHHDCSDAGCLYRSEMCFTDYWEGVPPLMDEIYDSGEAERELARLRGHFPHVVCRIEMHKQKADARIGETPSS